MIFSTAVMVDVQTFGLLVRLLQVSDMAFERYRHRDAPQLPHLPVVVENMKHLID